MKKKLLIIFCLLAFSCSNNSIEKLQVLGSDEFQKEKWANATQEVRGKMVYSFFRKNDIHNMVAGDIQNLLGPSTGYYNYDEFPAYIVGPKSVKSEYGNGYLLAFPIDRSSKKIKGFVIIPKIDKLSN